MSSPTSFNQASELLEECTRQGHDLCSRIQSLETTLPTRVIDCSDIDQPKIHITHGSQGIYIALSYVWGGDQQHKTTTKNIETYICGIAVTLLPQTIRDAIISTRELGLRYLWVDSLCILQDSEEDKGREIARMRGIYKDAHVTLIAACAQKASQGFLQDRPAPPPATRLPFRCPDRGIGIMSLRSNTVEPSEPTDTRAWCFQERLLASRALVYASDTLRYECNTHTVNIGNANGAIWRQDTRLPGVMLQPLSSDAVSGKEFEIESAWGTVIAGYSKRGITDPRDKLIALYGIAEVFHGIWNTSKYLAGLWQRNLLEELLWQNSAAPRFPRPAIYRAPSWSWVATDGEITPAFSMHHWGEDKSECEILQCEVTLRNEMLPFGEVTEGFLRLDAVLNKVLWNPVEGKIFAFKTIPPSNESVLEAQGALLGRAYPDGLEDVSSAIGHVWAIPLRSSSKVSQMIEGLIVVPSLAKGGHFRRVGMFQIPTGKPMGDTDIEAWMGTPRQKLVII